MSVITRIKGGFIIKYDPHSYRYPSRRSLVYGSRGMVCTSHPLAAGAGLDVLKKGGNAVDAAIATAAVLTVVQPTANGLGSDAFAIIWQDGRLCGINGSGPAPRALTLDRLRHDFPAGMPRYGWPSVMTPAAPAVWAELSSKMGRLPLAESLSGAISCARDGHAVSVGVAGSLYTDYHDHYTRLSGPEFAPWRDTFRHGGSLPGPGAMLYLPHHARTLEQIAATNARSFYEGEIAERIVAFSQATGGYIAAGDLADFRPEWVAPISTSYRGYDVWELPPNGQGITALLALGVMRGFDLSCEGATRAHRGIEAIKLGFADAKRYVADPRCAEIPVDELLSERYAALRRELVGETACEPEHGDPCCGGTVYLCAADGEGCMVSYIQSNYMGFGSFVVVPETGIALNNRGNCFSFAEGHANVLAPGKRPYNTIIPGFLTKDGAPQGPFGVMGGFMQPQGHVQVISNMIDLEMNPQEALDAPRWQWTGGMNVEVEPGFSDNDAQILARKGHNVRRALNPLSFGRGEIILRTPEGTLAGATEKRADGCAAAW